MYILPCTFYFYSESSGDNGLEICLYKVKKSFLALSANLKKITHGKYFINLWKTSLFCDQQKIYAYLGNFSFFMRLNVIPFFPSLARH